MKPEKPIIAASVWPSLAQDYWAKGPMLFTNACSPDLFTSQWILELLQGVRQRLDKGKSAKLSLYNRDGVCRSAADHSERANCGLAPYLPSSGHGTLDEFFADLAGHREFESFTLFLDRPHALHTDMWLTMHDVLVELYQHLPMAELGVGSDIFIGNYQKTPFDVHKDDLHNLMFMTEGRRIMHFWPDQKGESAPDQARKQSFEVGAGDILYWPPDYWHVGENLQGVAASVNIDIWERSDQSWARKSVEQAINSVTAPILDLLDRSRIRHPSTTEYSEALLATQDGPEAGERIAQQALDAISGPMLAAKLNKDWIGRLSSATLDRPIPPDTTLNLSAASHYKIRSDTQIVCVEHHGKLLLGCNGHVISKANKNDWQEIVSTVSAHEPFTSAELLELAPGLERHEIILLLQQLLEYRVITQL